MNKWIVKIQIAIIKIVESTYQKMRWITLKRFEFVRRVRRIIRAILRANNDRNVNKRIFILVFIFIFGVEKFKIKRR